MKRDERKCVVCGCTDTKACEGGCEWDVTDPPVCSRCTRGRPYVAIKVSAVAWGVSVPGPKRERINNFGGLREMRALAKDLNAAFLLGVRHGIWTTPDPPSTKLARGDRRGKK